MPKAGIIYNDSKPTAIKTAHQLEKKLKSHGYDVIAATGVRGILSCVRLTGERTEQTIAELIPSDFERDVEFAIVLGGDGTVLSACRQLGPLEIPLLAVNTGHMGFLTETYLNNISTAFEALVSGGYSVESRAMLKVQVFNDAQLCWEALSLNEMVLHKEPMTGMCHFEVQVGQHAIVDIAADGVILSTPTGSTAYALAAGGPVITPGVSVLQLIPICPHSLASRALVFDDGEQLAVSPANHEQLVMVVDGNASCYVSPEHTVRITKADYSAQFIRLKPVEYFKILREKLGWGLPHIAKPTSVELP
ncbi:MAG: NAD(+) kinase [Cyanobacteria bacterium P01_F01_bin.42]